MTLIKLLPLVFNVMMCGSDTPEIDPLMRIAGGFNTSAENVGGFLVAIRKYSDFLCGGSLISDTIVVTAAHCMSDNMKHIGALTVQGGVTLLTENTTRVRVAYAFIPKSYNSTNHDMDVSVLKLHKPLKGDKINTIKLCTHNYKEGDKVTVSGWGKGDFMESEPRRHLQSVILPMIAKSKCKQKYANITILTDAMICAGELNKKDACQYDSGGPLVLNDELCGIVSFGVKCADDYPGIYTDVKYVTPWINKAIANLMEKS